MNRFDKIVCINLPHRTDRRMAAQAQFDKFGLDVEWVAAHQHEDGRIGLQRTLLDVFKAADGNGYGTREHCRNILVFEDDIFFIGDDPSSTFEKAMGDIDFYFPRYDLLYLGANLTKRPIPVTPNISLIHGALAAHAVVYSDEIFQDYIDHLERVVAQGEIKTSGDISDVFLAKIQERGRSFIVNPKIATQRPSWSDIEHKFTDYTQILKP